MDLLGVIFVLLSLDETASFHEMLIHPVRDLETARHAVDELESIARDFDRPFFQAGALTARGELLLGEEKAAEASPVLGQSWRLWQSTDLPYESARARLHSRSPALFRTSASIR